MERPLYSTSRVASLNPPAVAGLALDVDVREEVHLHLMDPSALTGLAPAALDVETKPPLA